MRTSRANSAEDGATAKPARRPPGYRAVERRSREDLGGGKQVAASRTERCAVVGSGQGAAGAAHASDRPNAFAWHHGRPEDRKRWMWRMRWADALRREAPPARTHPDFANLIIIREHLSHGVSPSWIPWGFRVPAEARHTDQRSNALRSRTPTVRTFGVSDASLSNDCRQTDPDT